MNEKWMKKMFLKERKKGNEPLVWSFWSNSCSMLHSLTTLIPAALFLSAHLRPQFLSATCPLSRHRDLGLYSSVSCFSVWCDGGWWKPSMSSRMCTCLLGFLIKCSLCVRMCSTGHLETEDSSWIQPDNNTIILQKNESLTLICRYATHFLVFLVVLYWSQCWM